MSNIRILQDVTVYNSITALSSITVNDLTVVNNASANKVSIGGQALEKYNLAVFGDTHLNGNLTVAGSATFHNTQYSTTSALSVTNTGTGPAIYANQTGEQAVAAFYDDGNIALYVDGKTGTARYVGVGTETPNEALTVVGNISASNYLYANGINRLRVTEWGYPGASALRLTNAVYGESILIQSTDDGANEGRSSLRWHVRPEQSGAGSHYSQVDAQNDGIWIKNAAWDGSGGTYYWHFNNFGSITFPSLHGNDRTGTGENLQFAKTGTQKLISTSEGTSAQQTVERLVIAGGDSYYNTDTAAYEGEGGDVYLWAGKGDNGGDIKVDAGEGVNSGGTVKIRGAYTLSGTGGFVEVYAGDSNTGYGGPVDIHAGCGPLGGGNITLQTCEGGTHQLVLSSTGQLITPYNLVVQGSVSASGGIIGGSTIQKFVSAFGNGADTVYELNHSFSTEDVVVSIVDTATKEVVYPSVVNFTLSSIKVEFSEAPALTAFKAIVIG